MFISTSIDVQEGLPEDEIVSAYSKLKQHIDTYHSSGSIASCKQKILHFSLQQVWFLFIQIDGHVIVGALAGNHNLQMIVKVIIVGHGLKV